MRIIRIIRSIRIIQAIQIIRINPIHLGADEMVQKPAAAAPQKAPSCNMIFEYVVSEKRSNDSKYSYD